MALHFIFIFRFHTFFLRLSFMFQKNEKETQTVALMTISSSGSKNFNVWRMIMWHHIAIIIIIVSNNVFYVFQFIHLTRLWFWLSSSLAPNICTDLIWLNPLCMFHHNSFATCYHPYYYTWTISRVCWMWLLYYCSCVGNCMVAFKLHCKNAGTQTSILFYTCKKM